MGKRKRDEPRKPMPEKKEKQEIVCNETKYNIIGNLRCVQPYRYTYGTIAKQRWLKRTLFDVYTSEFGSYTPEYYKTCIETGFITVNGNLSTPDYIIKDSDRLEHLTHRHEPPVLYEDIKIVYEDESYVVVSKPCSIPVHESGAYRYNSLLFILAVEKNLKNLYPLHRLDRLTSGLVILGKNKEAAKLVYEAMENDRVQKTYLARVVGDFPSDPSYLIKNPLTCDMTFVSWVEDGTRLKVDIPLRVKSHKDGVHECSIEGKPSSTLFRKISFNGKTSLVEAMPITGRTHQIRLHLQYLGFPIANDPNYGGVLNYGFNESNIDHNVASITIDAENKREEEKRVEREGGSKMDGDKGEEKKIDGEKKEKDDESEVISHKNIVSDEQLKSTCRFCKLKYTDSLEAAFTDEHIRCQGMWLHALKYEVLDKVFTVPPPSWMDSKL